MWSFCRGYGPLQCTFLILIYLLYFRQAPNYHLVRHYVDRIIHHYISSHKSPDSSLANGSLDISKPPMPVAIQVLVELHRRLDLPVGSKELPPSALNLKVHQFRVPSTQLDTASNIPGPQLVQTSLAASLSATSHSETEHNTPSGATTSTPGSGNAAQNTVSNHEFFASMSDLEAWSSLLVTESDELLATFDTIISGNSTMTGS